VEPVCRNRFFDFPKGAAGALLISTERTKSVIDLTVVDVHANVAIATGSVGAPKTEEVRIIHSRSLDPHFYGAFVDVVVTCRCILDASREANSRERFAKSSSIHNLAAGVRFVIRIGRPEYFIGASSRVVSWARSIVVIGIWNIEVVDESGVCNR